MMDFDLNAFFDELDEILDLPMPGNCEAMETTETEETEGEVLQ